MSRRASVLPMPVDDEARLAPVLLGTILGKASLVTLLGIEPKFFWCLARRLVALPTTLFRLQKH